MTADDIKSPREITLTPLCTKTEVNSENYPLNSICGKYWVHVAIGIFITMLTFATIIATPFSKSDTDSQQPFELIGSWNDGFDTIVNITQNKWVEYYSDNTVVIRHITYYSNPISPNPGLIIAQNDQNNTWYPSKWNRIHYFHYKPQIWHFCTVYYNKENKSKAETPPEHPEMFNIDNTDTGCGGFPMSILVPLK
jgi:hypothetical protein